MKNAILWQLSKNIKKASLHCVKRLFWEWAQQGSNLWPYDYGLFSGKPTQEQDDQDINSSERVIDFLHMKFLDPIIKEQVALSQGVTINQPVGEASSPSKKDENVIENFELKDVTGIFLLL